MHWYVYPKLPFWGGNCAGWVQKCLYFLKLTVQQRGRFGVTITAVSFCVCSQVRLYDCLPAEDFLKHVILMLSQFRTAVNIFPSWMIKQCPTTRLNVCRLVIYCLFEVCSSFQTAAILHCPPPPTPTKLTQQCLPWCHLCFFSHYPPQERGAHIIFPLSSTFSLLSSVHGSVLWVFTECCCSPLPSSYFQKIKIHFPLFRSCLIIAYSSSPVAGINTGFSWTLISSSAGHLQQARGDYTAPHGATQAISHKSQRWGIISVRCNKKNREMCVYSLNDSGGLHL